MPFSESVKSEVKRLAAFRCCRCHEIGIEVHHIIPQEYDGPDDIDNAAPLCPNCHGRFGANSEKRKEIKQMRDWWYEIVVERYHGDQEKFSEISEILIKMQKSHLESLATLKGELQAKLSELQKQLTKVPFMEQPSNTIQHQANEYITATRLSDGVHANFQCRKCSTYVGLLIGTNQCPNCHTPI